MSEHIGIGADLTFEQWVEHVFDHHDANWHWDIDAPYWNPEVDPQTTLSFLVRLFSSPSFLIEKFTPNQIGVGLNYIVSPSCSDYAFVFLESSLPIDDRAQGIHAIATLYEGLFSQICLPEIQHGKWRFSSNSSKADEICYMFWDVFPMYARTKSPYDDGQVNAHWDDNVQIETACLDAMQRTLAIDHIACQEGALHGLGHWEHGYPERVHRVIDAYLKQPNLPKELVSYAKQARNGSVL